MSTVADLRGTLEEFPLGAVVELLAGSAQTGALHFSGPMPGVLCFDEGELCEAGEPDEAREQLVTALFEQLVTGETFEFRHDGALPVGPLTRFPAGELLDAARERTEQWREIAAAIPSTAAVLRVAPELPKRKTKATITADEWVVLARLDGTATVADVTLALERGAFEVMALLHGLLKAGLAEVADPG